MAKRDYSLLGTDGARAVETGLAAATWYHSEIPRRLVKDLMKRTDRPAIRDTFVLFGAMAVFAGIGVALWPSGWCAPFWLAYGVLYGSAMDSRWHECGHGTAFRTGWMSDGVVMTGVLQHGGLADNVLDHRLNSRTVYMNPISRFIYWNMNYHVEHHMFPMVPFHRLPDLHEAIKHDLPAPNTSIVQAYREMWPAVVRQLRCESHFLRRDLPATARPYLEDPRFEAPGAGAVRIGTG